MFIWSWKERREREFVYILCERHVCALLHSSASVPHMRFVFLQYCSKTMALNQLKYDPIQYPLASLGLVNPQRMAPERGRGKGMGSRHEKGPWPEKELVREKQRYRGTLLSPADEAKLLPREGKLILSLLEEESSWENLR